MPHFEHVFVVVEENESYDEVIGNTKDLPYLNALAAKYGLATNYFANTHPSVNNYFFLTSGRSGTRWPWLAGSADWFTGEVAGDNIASILSANGKSWKAYAESIPSAGYLGSDHIPYVKRHNPFTYFESVRNGKNVSGQSAQQQILFLSKALRAICSTTVSPPTRLSCPTFTTTGIATLRPGATLLVAIIAPCKTIDAWLNRNIKPLIESDGFQRTGLLVIVFDEACESGPKADWRYDPNRRDLKGGGHIPALIISSRTPAGATDDRLYHHESVPASAWSRPVSGRRPGSSRHGCFFPGQAKESALSCSLLLRTRQKLPERRFGQD
jgi:acid phosphatase